MVQYGSLLLRQKEKVSKIRAISNGEGRGRRKSIIEGGPVDVPEKVISCCVEFQHSKLVFHPNHSVSQLMT